MLWDDIKGHQEIKKTLINHIRAGRVGHAYLFVGAHGIGKRQTALAFAADILCGLERPESLQNQRLTCQQRILRNIHPDLRIWQTDKKSFSVSDIRAWQKDVWLPPTVAEKKIVVIDEAEKLTIQAQNALLKTLEEPPSDTVFILLTDSISEILSTVISRCRLIKFGRLTHNELRVVLGDLFPEKKDLKLLLHMCNGSPGQAVTLARKVDLLQITARIADIIELLSSEDIAGLLNETTNLVKEKVDIETLLYAIETIWSMALRQDKNINDIISSNNNYLIERPIWRLKDDCQHIINARKQLNKYQNKQLVMETLLLNILEVNNG